MARHPDSVTGTNDAPLPIPDEAVPGNSREQTDPAVDQSTRSSDDSGTVATSDRAQLETNLYEWEFRPPKSSGAPWATMVGILLALTALFAQAAIAFRRPLTVEFPEARPWLLRACEQLHCSLPLPRLDEKLHIESSGLEAINPAQPSQILLTAAVRNRATVTVAYPAIELTLTDERDLAIARRVFLPQEYVAQGVDLNRGFDAGKEINVRLFLDTADLRAAGYRLYLFYP